MVRAVPRVSVLMCCHNAARYLADAIESILAQTFSDFEFVIVDDGSQDETLDVISEYAAQDARIVVRVKQNTGLADSLNAGMRVARGQWIARLDADDVSLPSRLEKQVAYVDSHPGTVLVGSGFTEIDSTGKCLREHLYPARHDRCIRHIEKIGSFPPHSSYLYHRATAVALGGFNPRFRRSQDADLWLRLSRAGELCVFPMPLVKIRKHDDNISDDSGGRMQTLFGVAAHVCHLARVHGVPDPSCQSDADWEDFMEWLAARVEQRGAFEQRQQWAQLRQAYYLSGNRMASGCRLVKSLLRSRYAFSILRKKCFGWRLPLELAHEWIQRQCAVSSE